MNKKILNRILIEWNDSGIEDNGIIKASDVKDRFKYQLVYKLYNQTYLTIFYPKWPLFNEYKDKVYINGEHIKLNSYGIASDFPYSFGECNVYIEDWDKITDFTNIFWDCQELISATIPTSISIINNNAFYNCKKLKKVTIPSSIKKIDDYAFQDCYSLESITIPSSVKKIGRSSFLDCYRLKEVIIESGEDSVKLIDINAFANCEKLTSIIIPNSVKWICDGAFYNCMKLKTVYVENITNFNTIKFGDETANPTCYGAKLIELEK